MSVCAGVCVCICIWLLKRFTTKVLRIAGQAGKSVLICARTRAGAGTRAEAVAVAGLQ